MADAAALDRFLASVEKRAFRIAEMSVRNTADALDIVQDSMLTLVDKYAHRPEPELAPLFYRILTNRVTDFHRRQQRRNRLFAWPLRSASDTAGDDGEDAIQQFADRDQLAADQRLGLQRASEQLVGAVETLPLRQRQAFLLRIWEGLDVQQTATAMGCSQGSVKTHLSRAMHTLREHLGDPL